MPRGILNSADNIGVPTPTDTLSVLTAKVSGTQGHAEFVQLAERCPAPGFPPRPNCSASGGRSLKETINAREASSGEHLSRAPDVRQVRRRRDEADRRMPDIEPTAVSAPLRQVRPHGASARQDLPAT